MGTIGENMVDRDTMIVYRSFYESIIELPKENQAEVWQAVFELGLNFREIELEGLSKTVFRLMAPIIKKNNAQYINGKRPKNTEPKHKRIDSEVEAIEERSGSQLEANLKPIDSQSQAYKDKEVDKDKNEDTSSPTPSSAQPPKGRKKTKIETTKEQAILHYKTESEIAIQVAPAEGEKYANLGREICGMKTTECPNGMVKTVMRLPEQLTFEQYKRLCQKFGSHDAVREMLLAMHNDFDRYGLDKQQSVSLIAQKWFTNGKKRDAKGGFTTATSLPSAPSKKEYKA